MGNLWYASNVYYARQVALMNLCGLALVWVVSEIANNKRLKILLWTIIGAGVLVCLEGLYQWAFGRGILIPWANSGAPIATIGNTNYVGAYLIFVIFACLSVRLRYSAGPLAIALLILVASRARASWVAVSVGLAVYTYLSLKRRTFLILVLVSCLLAGIGWQFMPDRLRNTNTMGYRLKYWEAAVEIWKDSPIIGIGFDGYRVKVYEAQAHIAERNPGWFSGYIDPKPRRVHNEYLQALVDGGLLYAVAYFGFIFWVLCKSFKMAQNDKFTRGIWCGQVASLVCAFFFFVFHLCDTTMLFHINLGVLCATFTSSSSRA